MLCRQIMSLLSYRINITYSWSNLNLDHQSYAVLTLSWSCWPWLRRGYWMKNSLLMGYISNSLMNNYCSKGAISWIWKSNGMNSILYIFKLKASMHWVPWTTTWYDNHEIYNCLHKIDIDIDGSIGYIPMIIMYVFFQGSCKADFGS